jgi:hypothetical protein
MTGWSAKEDDDSIPAGIIVDGALSLLSVKSLHSSNHSWISQEVMQKVCPLVTLAEYQLIGVNWLALLHGLKFDVDGMKSGANVNGILADEMGLGKTGTSNLKVLASQLLCVKLIHCPLSNSTVQTIAFLAWLRHRNREKLGLSNEPEVIAAQSESLEGEEDAKESLEDEGFDGVESAEDVGSESESLKGDQDDLLVTDSDQDVDSDSLSRDDSKDDDYNNDETNLPPTDSSDEDDSMFLADDDEKAPSTKEQMSPFVKETHANHACIRPHLIVVPPSTLANWEHEFAKFCPHMRVITYHGNQGEREMLRAELRQCLKRPGEGANSNAHFVDVILTTFSYFRGEKPEDQSFLKRLGCDYLVVDEAHGLKNRDSQQYEKLDKINASHRLLLTGMHAKTQ